MDLLSYFRALRRRWLLIVVCVVMGAAIGAASTQLEAAAPKSRPYYKATATLQLDTSSSDSPMFNNVEQVAVLVTTGDVPDAVAKDLGGTEGARDLATKVVTTTASVPSTIDITATDPD